MEIRWDDNNVNIQTTIMNTLLTGVCSTYYHSLLGALKISVSEHSITEVLFCDEKKEEASGLLPADMPEVMQRCIGQLDEYFSGTRRQFDLPLHQKGTLFQQSVWKELTGIPYGTTISYLELSKRLGNIKAIRAAASTNGKNQIAIIVPCHRVIGANRELVGYAGGLDKKRWLLEHELKYAHGMQTLF
jgi:methylated-DNA-[protein]-cysteine S-methyltransferase